MTLDELKSLRQGEVVIFTKVDEKICEYHLPPKQIVFLEFQVGDEMTFLEIEDAHKIGAIGDVVNFLRNSSPVHRLPLKQRDHALRYLDTISHFCYDICNYIERKTQLERENKLEELGI